MIIFNQSISQSIKAFLNQSNPTIINTDIDLYIVHEEVFDDLNLHEN